MAEGNIKALLISAVFLTMIVMGGVGMMAHFNSYNSDFSGSGKEYSEINSTLNRYSDLTGEVESLSSSQDEGSFWDDLPVTGLLSTAWNGVTLLKSTVTIFTGSDEEEGLLSAGSRMLGVPSWVGVLFGLVVSIIVVFALWALVFQREP